MVAQSTNNSSVSTAGSGEQHNEEAPEREHRRRPPPRRSSSLLSGTAVVRQRLVYDHTCTWGESLPEHPPEALEVLGVQARHWRQLETAYNAVVVTKGKQWQRVHRVAAQGLLSLYFGFAVLLVLVWYLGSEELLAGIGLVGIFVLLGATILANILHDMARKVILLKPLQEEVVKTWNTSIVRERSRLRIRMVLRRHVSCRDRLYSLGFLYRRGNATDDDDTVASEEEHV